MKTSTYSRPACAGRFFLAFGALAVAASVAISLPSAAGYTDQTHARTEAIPALVVPPFKPGLSKNSRMVDTAIGLSNDGNVYVWGRTDMGMNGGSANPGVYSAPQQVPLPPGETQQITGGIYNMNAVTNDGTVWGWGFVYGRDGTDAAKPGGNPKQLRINAAWNGSGELLDRILTISSTEYAGAGIREDGTIWHWGENTGYGGNSGVGASKLAGLPDPTVQGNRPVYLKGAYTNFFTILENGDVYYWGGTGGASLPFGTNDVGASATYLNVLAPWMKANVPAGAPYIVAVDGGINMGAALLSDGKLVSWSRTDASRTGRGAPITPAVIPTLSNITSMQFGFTGVALMNNGGDLWGYGAGDDYGQFPTTPVHIDSNVTQYASGQGYYIWQRSDASFWAQGYNVTGAIGIPAGATVYTKREVSWDLGMVTR